MPIGRKRWSLHDGPQGSLRRLRCQLAEDGCADSQVVLAKQLLDEKCELEADRVANFKQALQWLTCAAEQAHPEARHMLRRCVGSGVMCAQSACVVRAKAALAASRQETVARKAARDLFNSLSNGEQFITTVQLERRIRDITAALHDDCADDDSPEEGRAIDEAPPLERLQAGDANGTLRGQPHTPHEYPEDNAPSEHIRNLTVDNLVSAAVDYCQGELPLESYELTLTDPSLKALDQIPLLQRAFLHPIVFIQVLYLKILYYFGGFSFRLSNVELSLVLIAYLSANTESLYHLVPLVLYYVSFAAMVICTFKMLHAKRQFIDFRKWSGLFLRYSDGNLQPDESENLFVRNNLGPFVQFFVALLVNLFLYPFIATQWVPFSEFCVVSVLLMFLTLLSFGTNGSPYPDPLALLSFGINVLAKYPYEKDTVVHQGWRFLDLHISNYPSYMVGNGVEFCLNARVFFSLLIPTILCVMAKRCKWQGLLRYTVPHCVTLSWLQMFITCSHGCTAYGLVRGTLALVCSFLFVPLVGVVSVALPAAACVQRAPLSAAACGVLVLSCVCACVCAGCVLARWERTRRFVTPFQLSIGAISLIYVGAQLTTSIQDGGVPSGLVELISDDKTTLKNILKNDFISDYEEQMYQISWDDYYTHCNSPAWAESNMADTQVKCAVLDGATVSWEGYVKQVKLRSTKNRWREWLQYLPPFTHEYVKCYYGQPYTHGCHHSDDSHTGRECQFVATVARNMGKRCHLDGYNEYTYEVAVTMETSRGILKRHADITLSYEHYFTNYTRLLRTDDKIAFKGTISNEKELYNVGNKVLNVKAYEINCLECKETRGMISKLPASSKVTQLVSTVVSDCAVSAKYILNFILNPVIVFK